MPIRNVKLTDHYDRFVSKKVEEGRFQDASEVMRAGLYLLEQQEREAKEKLALLRSLAEAGFAQIDQGNGIAVSSKAQLKKLIGAAGRRAAARVKKKVTRRS
jgi:antitoxin ParD1/3/4